MRCQFDMLFSTSNRARLAAAFASLGLALAIPSFASDATPAKKEGDIAKGKATAATVCAACHMPDGNSLIPQNPILAGQHAGYIEKQLHNFKMKAGAKEPERNNPIMMGFASILSDDDMKNLGAYYASQRPNGASAKRKELVAAGEKIYRAGIPEKAVPACSGCHSPNAAGIPVQYPRLAGQHSEYTEAQLNSFRLGQRKNSQQMMTIASKMSETDVAAVAQYLATLR